MSFIRSWGAKLRSLAGLAGASRRHNRLWMARLRKIAIVSVSLACLGGALFYAYSAGVFSKAGLFAQQKIIETTAHAGFRVQNILVSGRARMTQEELLSLMELREEAPLFSIDINALREKVAGVSWVKDVTVARVLPDTITINIEERVPVALWQHNKKMSVIDADGVPLTSDNLARYKDLPLIVGESAGTHVTGLLALLRAEPAVASHFASAVRIGGRRWDLHLDNGMVVKLPERDGELALRRLGSDAERAGLFEKDIRVIDLRTPEKMVVELSDNASPAAKTSI